MIRKDTGTRIIKIEERKFRLTEAKVKTQKREQEKVKRIQRK
jgi:hypothetical protein